MTQPSQRQLDYKRFLELFPMEHRFYQTFDDSGSNTVLLRSSRIIDTQELLRLNEDGAGIFYTPNTFNGSKRTAEMVKDIEWLYVDLDSGTKSEQTDKILSSPLLPSLIIESKNGYHVYFRVDGVFKKENWDVTIRGMIQFFDGDVACKDVSRVLRIPGFKHMKDVNDPFTIKIKADADHSYTEAQLMEAFKLSEEEVQSQKTDWSSFNGSEIPKGQRHLYATKYAGKLIKDLSSSLWDTAGWAALNVWNHENCNPPLEVNELRPMWDGLKKGHVARNGDDKTSVVKFVDWNQILLDSVAEEKNFDNVIPFGYDFLDKRLGGIFKGELIVMGGITGTGKTTFTINVANHVADSGKKVCVAALEERLTSRGSKAIIYKINETRKSEGVNPISYIDYQTGKVKVSKYEEKEAIKLLQRNIKYVETSSHITPSDLEAIYSQGFDLIILDHLHYFGGMNKENISKANTIEETVQHIKFLNIKYNTRTILVAHFKKLEENKRPTMTDFKDSIAIPQTADSVIMLWRDKSQTDDVNNQYETEFICPKSRNDVPAFTALATFNPNINDYVNFSQLYYGTQNVPSVVLEAKNIFNS